MNRHVHLLYTPARFLAHPSAVWFSIPSRQALQGASFTIGRAAAASDRLVCYYNQTATPFEWTPRDVKPSQLKQRYAHLKTRD
jgi:hypothetical protein